MLKRATSGSSRCRVNSAQVTGRWSSSTMMERCPRFVFGPPTDFGPRMAQRTRARPTLNLRCSRRGARAPRWLEEVGSAARG